MSWTPPGPDDTAPRWWGPAAILLGVAIMVPAGLTAAFQMDEANAMRHVTLFGLGEYGAPGRPGLLWLILTPVLAFDDPATSILAARVASMAASVVTLCAVWSLARRAAGAHSAVAAVVLLSTSMCWQGRSFEIRTDTFVTPLLLLVMIQLWRPTLPWRRAVLGGVLLGLAGLLSQKSIYGAVGIALGWLALVGVGHIKWQVRGPLLAIASALGVVAVWYVGLSWLNGDSELASRNLGNAAANAFINQRPMVKKLAVLGHAGNRAPLLYLCLLPGALLAWSNRRRTPLLLAVAVVSAFSIATIFWHRGFYLYYVANFEPHLAVAAGAGFVATARFLPGGGRYTRWLVIAACLAALPSARFFHRAMMAADNEPQLSVLRAVKEAFPEPVPYWDSVGLVPGYRETTLFNTGANRSRHRDRHGNEFLIKFARERHPRFFIRNYLSRDRVMKAPERAWVWRHFVPYRSNLYLRGGRIRVDEGGTVHGNVEIAPAGAYTVHFWGGWTGEASLNGAPVRDGDVVQLPVGEARISGTVTSGSGQLWLIVGEDRVPEANNNDEIVDLALFPEVGRRGWFDHFRNSGTSSLLGPPIRLAGKPVPGKEVRGRRRGHAAYHHRRDEKLAWPKRRLPRTEP
jgi:hypothetical protein